MSSDGDDRKKILLLRCDRSGRVVEYLMDHLNAAKVAPIESPLANLIGEEDRVKLERFLERIQSAGSTLEWPMVAQLSHTPSILYFSGFDAGEDCLVSASLTRDCILGYEDEMLRMSNEQTNIIRSLGKELNLTRQASYRLDEDAFEDLSRVNNDLANLQRQVAKQNAELERLNRIKNQWLGMAAHDMRGPLGVIQSFGEFLEEEATEALNSEQMEFLNIITRTSRFLRQLVDDMLDVAAIESGQLELHLQILDLSEVIRENIHINQTLALGQSKKIDIDIPKEPVRIKMDAHKINQVLNNLIGNAIKYSKAGSRTTLTVRTDGPRVRVAVKDQGPGIDPAEQDQLFCPFGKANVRSTTGEQSTGLGLAIVRRIVEAHGGRVGLESALGKGSTFWFEIPTDQHERINVSA